MNRKKATKLIPSGSEFLRDVPLEIEAILAWFHEGADPTRLSKKLEHYAGSFLVHMHEDGALFPVSKNTAWLLAMALTHHVKDPNQPIGWLNLGLALRRMVLYRKSAPESLKKKWLDGALQSLDRCLELEPKNPRAWRGRGLVFLVSGQHEEEAECYRRALELHPSNLDLWLLYVNALNAAGKEDEAFGKLEEAYQWYLLAGQPEELRDIFGKLGPGVQADLTQIH